MKLILEHSKFELVLLESWPKVKC